MKFEVDKPNVNASKAARKALRKRNKHRSNLIDLSMLNSHFSYDCSYIFESKKSPDNEYMVKIVKCGDSRAIKLCNNVEELQMEWDIIDHLKTNLKHPSSFVRESEAIKIDCGNHYKYGIAMPKMVDIYDLEGTPPFSTQPHKYAKQVIDQLADIHSCKVLHGDIKEDNLMYNPSCDEMCIIDFGLSEIIETTDEEWNNIEKGLDIDHEVCTSYHRAPECFEPTAIDKYQAWEKKVEDLEDDIVKSYHQDKLERYKEVGVLLALVDISDLCDERTALISQNGDNITNIEQEVKELDTKIETCRALKREHEELEVAMRSGKTNILEKQFDVLIDDAPKCMSMLERHNEVDVGDLAYSFTQHITKSADVYALGVVFSEYFDLVDFQQQELVERMCHPDIEKRVTIEELKRSESFDKYNNGSTETSSDH